MLFFLLLCQVLCTELEFLKELFFALKKTDWSVDGVRLSGFGYELDI